MGFKFGGVSQTQAPLNHSIDLFPISSFHGDFFLCESLGDFKQPRLLGERENRAIECLFYIKV